MISHATTGPVDSTHKILDGSGLSAGLAWVAGGSSSNTQSGKDSSGSGGGGSSNSWQDAVVSCAESLYSC